MPSDVGGHHERLCRPARDPSCRRRSTSCTRSPSRASPAPAIWRVLTYSGVYMQPGSGDGGGVLVPRVTKVGTPCRVGTSMGCDGMAVECERFEVGTELFDAASPIPSPDLIAAQDQFINVRDATAEVTALAEGAGANESGELPYRCHHRGHRGRAHAVRRRGRPVDDAARRCQLRSLQLADRRGPGDGRLRHVDDVGGLDHHRHPRAPVDRAPRVCMGHLRARPGRRLHAASDRSRRQLESSRAKNTARPLACSRRRVGSRPATMPA